MVSRIVRESTQRILQVNPSMTYAEIGRLLGVSRERIRQIAGQSTHRQRVCKVCGVGIRSHEPGMTKTAYNLRYCPACWAIRKGKKKTHQEVSFVCTTCQSVFTRRVSEIRKMDKNGQTVRWCSKKCQGKWLGTNYGLGRRKSGDQREVTYKPLVEAQTRH